ncbi:MAG: excalibur calcium-binding domain-containing protein [Pseudomonadota bacterium]
MGLIARSRQPAAAMSMVEQIRNDDPANYEMSSAGKWAWRIGIFGPTVVLPAFLILTSPFSPPVAAKHWATAAGGCTLGSWIGTAPAREDAPGYHAHLDHDNDGMACEQVRRSSRSSSSIGSRAGGAKVIRH